MKLIEQIQSEKASDLFLYGAFMMSNLDYVGIVDYVIKAGLGAMVWFGIKLLNDRWTEKVSKVKKRKVKKEEEDEHPQ